MFWTRFEPDDEARFRARFAERSIPFLRFALPVAIIVYLFFLFWDYAVNPVDLGTTLAIRLYFCVLAIVAFGFTYLRFFRRWMQAIMCGTVILGATGIILAVFLVPEGFRIGTSAILIAVMFACGLARLLFWSAFVACASIGGKSWSSPSIIRATPPAPSSPRRSRKPRFSRSTASASGRRVRWRSGVATS